MFQSLWIEKYWSVDSDGYNDRVIFPWVGTFCPRYVLLVTLSIYICTLSWLSPLVGMDAYRRS